ncbi:rab3 GTPase-activating protein catalytic subunit-like isoform X3 [Gossypium australe]|uniref:Rab3 GTPase-activating protein catalytic subunit-like isoform X3 n=1 Tax=Gossypium australe TaxID=47621 RepID=A0A5B6UKB8_9ROSI|nr:rab3 GTPase-activating protein catalytic subunit-like isoform X3 [Gossypium australe]
MASSSKANLAEQDEGEEAEEIEHFNDFTLASSWERFISEIEATCRQWLADGPKRLLEKGAVHLDSSDNIYKVKSELKNAAKIYSMEYYFEISGKIADWNCTLHDLQLCFGVKEFLVISPQSASGVVLDAPEATKLLSAVSIALANCSSLWPAFVPVHDPSRKAFIGIQNMGTIFTRRFEADRIGSQVPIKFMHLEGLYELFVSKFYPFPLFVQVLLQIHDIFAFTLTILLEIVLIDHLFLKAYCMSDHSMHLFRVHLLMKLTYQTLPNDEDNYDDIQEADTENAESETSPGCDNPNRKHWDDDCPWNEWYSAEDPVMGKLIYGHLPSRGIANFLSWCKL